ncbi:MAG: hypothetical protein ACXWQO_07220 [Bdellovibrionota bacterium]
MPNPRLRLLFISFIGSLGILAFNLCIPSLLNFYFWSMSVPRWHRYMDYIVNLHQTSGTFQRRAVVTFLIESISHLTQLDYWWSFLIVQLLLLTSSAYLLGSLAAKIQNHKAATASLCVFFLSFTVLFSFVTPNDCFDEYAQYLFLFLALNAFLSQRHAFFGIFYFLALISRETSAFLLPGLLLLDFSRDKNPTPRVMKFVIPIVAYTFYFSRLNAGDDPRRFFHLWQDNFAGWQRSFETIVSLLLAVGLPVILLLGAGVKRNSEKAVWVTAFWITLPINTVMVFVMAEARESRLLALPLIFLWPICGEWLAELVKKIRAGIEWNLAKLGLGVLGAAVLFEFYNPGYRHVLGYRIYAAMIPLLAAIALMTKDTSSREYSSRK